MTGERGSVTGERGSVTDERGSVTVVLVAVVAMAAMLAVGVARLGAAAAAQARAETAADAAALAAADMLALGRGGDIAVRTARETARANGAELVTCECSGKLVTVVVRLRSGPRRAGSTATARARAEIRPLVSVSRSM